MAAHERVISFVRLYEALRVAEQEARPRLLFVFEASSSTSRGPAPSWCANSAKASKTSPGGIRCLKASKMAALAIRQNVHFWAIGLTLNDRSWPEAEWRL